MNDSDLQACMDFPASAKNTDPSMPVTLEMSNQSIELALNLGIPNSNVVEQ